MWSPGCETQLSDVRAWVYKMARWEKQKLDLWGWVFGASCVISDPPCLLQPVLLSTRQVDVARPLYIVTPTYTRPTQLPDLTRLANTLRLVSGPIRCTSNKEIIKNCVLPKNWYLVARFRNVCLPWRGWGWWPSCKRKDVNYRRCLEWFHWIDNSEMLCPPFKSWSALWLVSLNWEKLCPPVL